MGERVTKTRCSVFVFWRGGLCVVLQASLRTTRMAIAQKPEDDAYGDRAESGFGAGIVRSLNDYTGRPVYTVNAYVFV